MFCLWIVTSLWLCATGVHCVTTFNAALGKNASQSSKYPHADSYYFTADKAVDGNTDPRFEFCASTDHRDFNVWWKVDLGMNYIVTSVRITNRNHVPERLHDVTVTVSTDDNTWSLCGQYLGEVPWAATVTVTCDQAMWGRYVKITKPVDIYTDILTLCEVQVIAVERTYAVFKQQGGKTTTSDVILTMTGELLTCGRACKHTIDCLGINYNSGMKLCELTNSTKSEVTTFNNGWIFYLYLP